jgi:hypothetical protein
LRCLQLSLVSLLWFFNEQVLHPKHRAEDAVYFTPIP